MSTVIGKPQRDDEDEGGSDLDGTASVSGTTDYGSLTSVE